VRVSAILPLWREILPTCKPTVVSALDAWRRSSSRRIVPSWLSQRRTSCNEMFRVEIESLASNPLFELARRFAKLASQSEMRCRVVIPFPAVSGFQHSRYPGTPQSCSLRPPCYSVSDGLPVHSVLEKSLRRKICSRRSPPLRQEGETLAICYRIPFNLMNTRNFVTSLPWPGRERKKDRMHLPESPIGNRLLNKKTGQDSY